MRFDAEGLVLKRQVRLSMSVSSSFVNNHDAPERGQMLNEGVCKAAEDAWQEDMRKKMVLGDGGKANLTAEHPMGEERGFP